MTYPIICLLIPERYKPGDLPPEDPHDYLNWHEWADVQYKAGIRQTPCPSCKLWLTPQEHDVHACDKGLVSTTDADH